MQSTATSGTSTGPPTLHVLPDGETDMAPLGPFFSVRKWYGATGQYFQLQRALALHEGRLAHAEHDYDRLTAFLAERWVSLDIIVREE